MSFVTSTDETTLKASRRAATKPDRIELPRGNAFTEIETPKATGLFASLIGLFRRHRRPVAAVMLGATALTPLIGQALQAPANDVPNAPDGHQAEGEQVASAVKHTHDHASEDLAHEILFCKNHKVEARALPGQRHDATPRTNIYDPSTGLTKSETQNPHFPLPFRMSGDQLKEEFTIGAGFSDYQHYVMDESNPKPVDAPHYGDYVHGGIDFRVPAGTPVYSVTGGRVELQLGAKYHSTVTIHELDAAGKDSGRRWVYAHIDADTVPNAVKEAAKNGSALPAGTDIGNVTPWLENVDGIPDQIDRSDAKRYDHLHLNMIVRDSSGKDRYYNSAKYFKIADSVKPTIKDVHFVPDNQSNSFAGDSPILSGKVDVLINAVDHINGWDYRGGQLSENPNGASFDLGVHQARVKIKSVRTGRIVHNSETPAFDHMPDPSDRSTVHNAYVREVKANGVIHRARGDRFGRKNFLAATNVVNGKFNSDGHWDTRSVANGDYQVEITVKDFSGNKTTTTRLVHVSNQ